MPIVIVSALLLSVLAAPVQAQVYPVQGKWGQSSSTAEGTIDCTKNNRVIELFGDHRTDSNGGVPSYRNVSVRTEGPSTYRIVDEFSTSQISGGQTTYAPRTIDPDHIEMNMPDGSSLKLQRCK